MHEHLRVKVLLEKMQGNTVSAETDSRYEALSILSDTLAESTIDTPVQRIPGVLRETVDSHFHVPRFSPHSENPQYQPQ